MPTKSESPKTSGAKSQAGRRKSARALQQAYARLNTSATEERSLYGDLEEIMAMIVEEARRLYESANHHFDVGDYRSAEKLAHAVTEVATIIDIVCVARASNTLKLSKPPESEPIPPLSAKEKHKSNGTSLSPLQAYIFEFLNKEPRNEFLAGELKEAYVLLSKTAQQMEKIQH